MDRQEYSKKFPVATPFTPALLPEHPGGFLHDARDSHHFTTLPSLASRHNTGNVYQVRRGKNACDADRVAGFAHYLSNASTRSIMSVTSLVIDQSRVDRRNHGMRLAKPMRTKAEAQAIAEQCVCLNTF